MIIVNSNLAISSYQYSNYIYNHLSSIVAQSYPIPTVKRTVVARGLPKALYDTSIHDEPWNSYLRTRTQSNIAIYRESLAPMYMYNITTIA
jgi:hypothetical protein